MPTSRHSEGSRTQRKAYTTYQVSRRKRRWRRVVLLSFLLVLVLALAGTGAGYIWFSHLVGSSNKKVSADVKSALKDSKDAQVNLPADPGAMNILLLGSDSRGTDQGRSDTMMVIHVDPSQGYIGMLSIPRDLRVDIPGHGLNKINAAYSYGGAALAIRTVKRVTGININHYIEMDFKAFQDLTNTLGGVYVDVDKYYYNDNPASMLINLKPGYQLLDGSHALEYVRFRDDQNADFGREQRQQRFLSDVKSQMEGMGAGLIFKLPSLTTDLFNNVGTDLSATDILRLAYFGLKLSGSHIKQVRITGSTPTIGGISYVVAGKSVIDDAVLELLSPPSQTAAPVASATSSSGVQSASQDQKAVPSSSKMPDLAFWTNLAREVPFPVEGPGYIPKGYAYDGTWPPNGGTYNIAVGGGTKPAFRILYRYGKLDQYLGLTETTWTGAPAAAKGEQVVYKGTTFTLVGSSQAPDHVWWVKNGVLFFASNTLSYLLNSHDLIQWAESCVPVAGGQ